MPPTTLQIPVKLLTPDAKIPRYFTDGSACFDFYACHPNDAIPLHAGVPSVVRTGVAVEIPQGYVLMLYSRSGMGFNYDVRLSNCVGVVDSDYRGEVMVKLIRDRQANGNVLYVKHHDRIAQGMIIPIPAVEFVTTDELSETARSHGGLGSTGA